MNLYLAESGGVLKAYINEDNVRKIKKCSYILQEQKELKVMSERLIGQGGRIWNYIWLKVME